MSGSRSKKSEGKYDDPKSGKSERPSLGTGMAEGAAEKIESAKARKEKRLKEIMEGK